jgi:hypothetical protein
MLSHMTLIDYYRSMFALAQHHKYSIDTIESLMPFERDIYFEMLVEFIEQTKPKGR